MARLYRKIDAKYEINDKGDIVKQDDGTPIPHEEPLFLFRAQDALAGAAIRYYADLVRHTTGNHEMANVILDQVRKMDQWTPRKLPD